MAVVKTGSTKYESWIGIAEEATFGTAIADGSNFQILQVNGGAIPSFNPTQFTETEIRNRAYNMPAVEDYFKTESGQWQRYQIPEFTAPADVLAKMVYGATQVVSEAVGDPYLKTYSMDGTTDPNFSSNAGFFFTLLVKSPLASFSQKLTSCVMESLTIRISNENGGRCVVSGTALTGRGYTGTSNPSGTNAYSTVGVPNFFDSTASTLAIGGQDCVYYSCEATITNTFDWLGDTAGVADNYKLLSQRVTGTAVIKYDANTDTFLNAKGTDIGAFAWTIGANSADPYFKLGASECWITDVTKDNPEGSVQQLTVNYELLIDSTGANTVDFEVADGVDQTW